MGTALLVSHGRRSTSRRHPANALPGDGRHRDRLLRSVRSVLQSQRKARPVHRSLPARVKLRLDGFLRTSDEDFEASMQLNFFAALRPTRAAVEAMLPRGEGAIVNVVSVNSLFQPDSLVIGYGAAKAALLNVSIAIAGAWSAGHPHQQRLLGPSRDRSLARRPRRRRDDRPRLGPRPERGPPAGDRGDPYRPFQHPRRGGDARGAARLTSHRQRDGRELRDRRRTREDDAILEPRKSSTASDAARCHQSKVAIWLPAAPKR